MDWRIFHKSITASTNEDALAGVHGDVFTADFQTAGRGRGSHTWLQEKKQGLAMSVVLDVSGLAPEYVSTSSLTVGAAVAAGVERLGVETRIKWPNDVFAGGRKLAGILCRRNGDLIVAGIGVNVRQKSFPDEIASRAVSLAMLGADVATEDVRDVILEELRRYYEMWKNYGLRQAADGVSLPPQIAAELCRRDMLKGHKVSIMQLDEDRAPVCGVCDGISSDGALIVGGKKIYSGEAIRF